jgi:hypothetical protein
MCSVMGRLTASLVALAFLLLGAGAVPPPAGIPPLLPPPAGTPPPTPPPLTLAERAAAIESVAEAPDGERVVLGHLSRKLGMTADVLRAQRTRTGLGWGDIFIANRLAAETHEPLDDLVAELRGGKAWEDIARARGADLARLSADVRTTEDVVEQHAEDKAPHANSATGKGGRAPGGAARGRRY